MPNEIEGNGRGDRQIAAKRLNDLQRKLRPEETA